jgi:glycosyltransferase involved in cell wall biosynthesis
MLVCGKNKKMAKCLIYSPYFKGVGGGERYMLTVAECLLNQGWKVDFFWDNKIEIYNIASKLDLKLEKSNVLGIMPKKLPFGKQFRLTRSYDMVFWLSDGSVPTLLAKKNILHFQQPFMAVGGEKIINQIKLGFINEIVCNSKFTKNYIDKEFGVNSKVLFPPVDVDKFKPAKKENIILSVGRFEKTKKHGVLLKAFRKFLAKGVSSWKLVLIGGSPEEGNGNRYLTNLRKKSKDLPVDIKVNLSFSQLQEYYGKAKFYWHAKGFQVDESRPGQMEHFGITPVEAMSAGCVPLVVNKGGLKEIVRRKEGERWEDLNQLVEKTYILANNKEKYLQFQKNALKRSKDFSKQKFCKKFTRIIK